MFNPIHRHLLIEADITGGVATGQQGKDLLVKLVELADMVPVTMPQCVFVEEEGNEGPTGSINLASSHIAFHQWDETGKLQLDIYSCKCFNTLKILEFLDTVFGFRSLNAVLIDRDSLSDMKILGKIHLTDIK